jgi:hypothetical protein
MTLPTKRSSWRLIILVVLAANSSMHRAAAEPQAAGKATKLAGDRWSISDADFVAQYDDFAIGGQEQQSRFAWMSFARANQQVISETNQQKFSQWELWPDDPATFSPDAPRFDAAKKIRTRPHLQPLQQLRMFSPHMPVTNTAPFPQAGQEVTRNPLSYDYIVGKNLNNQQGIASFLGTPGNKIEFPLGVVETKAFWVRGSVAGAYQLGGFSLTALHLMVKVRPTPNNPFTDTNPSWFWTTFELKSNQGLAAAQKFITYADVLPASDSKMLVKQAGLDNTPFINYVLNGQQLQFSDSKNPTIILGNTHLEWPFATPPNQDPTTWTKWSSSCHSCHAQASGVISGNGVNAFNFTAPVGPLTGNALPSASYKSYDFVWALELAQ